MPSFRCASGSIPIATAKLPSVRPAPKNIRTGAAATTPGSSSMPVA
jgi:hypothetical protein